jgi:hypothetical protein
MQVVCQSFPAKGKQQTSCLSRVFERDTFTSSLGTAPEMSFCALNAWR